MDSGHLTRAEEMDKAFMMAKLFREPFYTRIVKILSEKKRNVIDDAAQDAFFEVYNDAFKGSNLEANYGKWLWNYLSNYDPTISPTW